MIKGTQQISCRFLVVHTVQYTQYLQLWASLVRRWETSGAASHLQLPGASSSSLLELLSYSGTNNTVYIYSVNDVQLWPINSFSHILRLFRMYF